MSNKTTIQSHNTRLNNLLEDINNLPEAGGIELPALDNEGAAVHILSGKQLINQEGEIVEGTMPNNGTMFQTIDGINTKSVTIPFGFTLGGNVSLDNTIGNEVTTQTDLIAQIAAAVDDLPEAGSGNINLQNKTITPTTSIQNITADSEYDGLETVTVNAIPNTYVKPMTTKSATTYTPTTSDQTIASGTYCSGVQTIKGDANLIPANIVSGKTIFGIVGSAEVGGGGGSGTIETCSGSLTFESPPVVLNIHYVNSNKELVSLEISSACTLNPMKNSIIYLEGWSAMSFGTGSIQQISYIATKAAYFVTGDFTLVFTA